MSRSKIFVALLPDLFAKNWHSVASLAIVIDTLRFSSTACQALAAGAKSIAVAADVADARLAVTRLGKSALLCGERHCRKIGGFDLGNSPLEYTPSAVAGRDLVFSTTNGTRAVTSVAGSKHSALGSFLNLAAIAAHGVRLLDQGEVQQIVLVCAGTDGEIAAEDVLTAGAIVERLFERGGEYFAVGNDSTLIARSSWQRLSDLAGSDSELPQVIQRYFEQTAGGRNLIEAGFPQDVMAASNLNALQTVPARTAGNGLRYQRFDQLSSE